MNYCIYGSGSRECSTFYKLCHDFQNNNDRVYIISEQENALLSHHSNFILVKNDKDLLNQLKYLKIQIVIILSTVHIIEGKYNFFKKYGYKVFGLDHQLTILENSKLFSKKFMNSYGIQTPSFNHFTESKDAVNYIENNWTIINNFVIKSNSSLNTPHYVYIPKNLSKAVSHIYELKNYNFFTTSSLLIEQKVTGYELSLHIFTDGESYQIMPLTQDYKKMYEDDEGPNTSGIGCLSTTYPILSDTLMRKIEKQIIIPFLEGIQKEFDTPYKYILYLGVMVDEDEDVYCLECNVRSGNPEWTTLLPLLKTPLNDIIHAIHEQKLHKIKIEWEKDMYAMCVMMIGAGFPNYKRPFEYPINGIEEVQKDKNITLIGENIVSRNGRYCTGKNAERVLGLVQKGDSLEQIRKNIYNQAERINYKGYYYRSDIGEYGFKLK